MGVRSPAPARCSARGVRLAAHGPRAMSLRARRPKSTIFGDLLSKARRNTTSSASTRSSLRPRATREAAGEAGGGEGGGGAASRGAPTTRRRPRALERSPRGRRRRLHRRDEVARVGRDERLGRVDEIRVAPGGRGREDLREVFPDRPASTVATAIVAGSPQTRMDRATIIIAPRSTIPRARDSRRRDGRRGGGGREAARATRATSEGEPLRARVLCRRHHGAGRLRAPM